MKLILQIIIAALLLSTLNSQLSTSLAQGTAFTYQGRLNSSGSPASGLYDFRFKLAADPLGNSSATGYVLTNGVPVTNGLFMVAIDFGTGIFNGSNYWLDVEVRTNNPANTLNYTPLTPLQAVTPTPYAIFANTASNVVGSVSSASLSGTYGSAVTLNNAGNNFSGSYSGNGANVTNVNAANLNGLNATNFWQLGGNTVSTGQFLGSTNNQPVEIRVNNARALRLEPGSGQPNVIGGAANNVVTSGATGATISGGSANTNSGNFATVGGGFDNQALGNYSSVPGGYQNLANGAFSFAGGHNAVANSEGSFVWSDSTGAATDNGSNNFIVSATGGIVMNGGPGKEVLSGNQLLLNPNGYNYTYLSSGGGMYLESGGEMYLDSQIGIIVNSQNAVSLESSEVDIVAPSGVQLDPSTSLFFGQTLRQTLNLYGTSYAIGVQNLTLFNRGDGDFAWYEHGTYTNALDNPGPGGTLLMLLNGSGDLTMKRNVYAVSFNTTSDRNAKENFSPIDPHKVLDKVAALPITRWNFKTDAGTEHIGPMAQDFYSAFNVGTDDKHISTVDEGGVALAAIQGLNQKLNDKDAEIQTLKQQNDALTQRLNKLEATVKQIAEKK